MKVLRVPFSLQEGRRVHWLMAIPCVLRETMYDYLHTAFIFLS